jgi:hypothetical protein
MVNTWIWEHHNEEVNVTGNYIGKIEQGLSRWPRAVYREAFRAILGASTDSALGFVNSRSRRTAVKLGMVNKVKRQKFVRTVTVGGVSGLILGEPVAELLEGIGEPTPPPARVGATDIKHIRTATRVFEPWSNAYGGGAVREVAMAQLRSSAGLLEAICPDQLLPELHAALGELAESAGFMALDAGAQAEARRVFGFALVCAEQAKDWNLRARVLSSMAAQAVSTGQPDEGLTLAEHALVRADWLTPATRSLLHTDRARALARMRRVQDTLRAVGAADEHFAHVTPDNEPSFMADYTAGGHALFTGRPLGDLAILGRDPGEATTRLTTAVAGFTEDRTRPRAGGLTTLASLTMATGDPRQAVAIGNQALQVADTLHSHLTTEKMRELFRHAAAHQDLGDVAELRHRIRTLVCTNHPENLPSDHSPD